MQRRYSDDADDGGPDIYISDQDNGGRLVFGNTRSLSDSAMRTVAPESLAEHTIRPVLNTSHQLHYGEQVAGINLPAPPSGSLLCAQPITANQQQVQIDVVPVHKNSMIVNTGEGGVGQDTDLLSASTKPDASAIVDMFLSAGLPSTQGNGRSQQFKARAHVCMTARGPNMSSGGIMSMTASEPGPESRNARIDDHARYKRICRNNEQHRDLHHRYSADTLSLQQPRAVATAPAFGGSILQDISNKESNDTSRLVLLAKLAEDLLQSSDGTSGGQRFAVQSAGMSTAGMQRHGSGSITAATGSRFTPAYHSAASSSSAHVMQIDSAPAPYFERPDFKLATNGYTQMHTMQQTVRRERHSMLTHAALQPAHQLVQSSSRMNMSSLRNIGQPGYWDSDDGSDDDYMQD